LTAWSYLKDLFAKHLPHLFDFHFPKCLGEAVRIDFVSFVFSSSDAESHGFFEKGRRIQPMRQLGGECLSGPPAQNVLSALAQGFLAP
jgi:hypothetical protein